MKNLWIVGAGGFGREVYSWACDHKENNVAWRIAGFIDDVLYRDGYENNRVASYIAKGLQLKSLENYQPTVDDVFVLAIASNEIRRKVVAQLQQYNATILTFIHPTAIVGKNVEIGLGAVICPQVILTCDIVIGEAVIINIQSCIGHDVEIGDYVTISGGVHITGACKIANDVNFGTNSSLAPRTKVEDFAFIGANSLGVGKVKQKTTVVGVPARKMQIGK